MRSKKIEIKRIEIVADGYHAVVLGTEGGEVKLLPGMSFTMFDDLPVNEIVEEKVHEITIEVSAGRNMAWHPKDAKAKWFKDELGQLWVKFKTSDTTERVFPAIRVVEVSYLKPPS